MEITDVISIGLGVLSVVLALCAIWQARRYKIFADRVNNDMAQIYEIIKRNSEYSAVEIRKCSSPFLKESQILNLHKDELCILKTSKYKPCYAYRVIDKLSRELQNILKETYILTINENLNLEDDTTTDLVAVVTLKRQYEKEDLDIIRRLNETFDEDGIRFEIQIS